jgi:hypothetical protein
MEKKIFVMFACSLLIFIIVPSTESLNNNPSHIISNYSLSNIFENWTELQKLFAPDGSAGDIFGVSVSIDGDTALIGAYYDDDSGLDSGSAYIFTRNGNTWLYQVELLASDGSTEDYFGYSVALDNNTALIGAIGDDGMRGAAYVFMRTGNTWTQQAKLVASDGSIGDWFGYSVSINNNTSLVGVQYDSENGWGSGSAYVFFRNGTNWSEQAKLLPSDGATSDYFGHCVCINQDTALIGAPCFFGKESGETTGQAYVFIRNDTNWIQQAKLLPLDGMYGDMFGSSLSIDHDNAIISSGRGCYAFFRNGTIWIQQSKLFTSDGVGIGGSISIDGNNVLITGPSSAYVFTQSGFTWYQKAKLIPSDGEHNQQFGCSVSLDGDIALIGAYGDNNNGTYTGSAYIFEKKIENYQPNAPMIDGPSNGKTNIAYQWNFTSTDPNDDDIFYYIDWGDDSNTGWSLAYKSGQTMPKSHSYSSKGTYTISAKTKDIYGAESNWTTLPITMPYSNDISFQTFWTKLFQTIPHAFPILRHMMGY